MKRFLVFEIYLDSSLENSTEEHAGVYIVHWALDIADCLLGT